MLLKLLRILSGHDESIKLQFLDHIDDILTLITKQSSLEISVECLGILGNVGTLHNFDFQKCIKNYDILPTLLNTFKKSQISKQLNQDDDVLLESLVLIGSMLNDRNALPFLIESGIPTILVNLIVGNNLFVNSLGKEEDDEIVLQILYCLDLFLYNETCRDQLISSTGT